MAILDDLAFLERYGLPRVSRHTKGWYCSLDVILNVTGAKFEISSDFDRPDPTSATVQCRERLETALRQFGAPDSNVHHLPQRSV